jgi:hypothetical protein
MLPYWDDKYFPVNYLTRQSILPKHGILENTVEILCLIYPLYAAMILNLCLCPCQLFIEICSVVLLWSLSRKQKIVICDAVL